MRFFRCFRKPEIFGSLVQLCIFLLLLPFLGILFGILVKDNPSVQSSLLSAVIGKIPLSNEIQYIALGYDSVGSSMYEYFKLLLGALNQDMSVLMYVGMWMTATRIIFKEYIPIPGIPIFQTVAGMLLGAFTLNIVSDAMMRIFALLFLLALNFFLIIITLDKPILKKFIDIIIYIPLQAYQAFLVSSYATVIITVFMGGFSNVTAAITAIVVPTLLWIIFLTVKYIFAIK